MSGGGSGRCVWLVGMMGSGKSTVGPRVARRLGVPFVDSDEQIEALAGQEIAAIFETLGEVRFRELEREAIERVAGTDAIVALGGGAIAQPGAPERLAGQGAVVYLRASASELLSRVGEASQRPLLAGLDAEGRLARLESLLAERESAYSSAAIVVDTDGAHLEDVADEVVRRLIDYWDDGGAGA